MKRATTATSIRRKLTRKCYDRAFTAVRYARERKAVGYSIGMRAALEEVASIRKLISERRQSKAWDGIQ